MEETRGEKEEEREGQRGRDLSMQIDLKTQMGL
jgi:hypothetical protein